MKLEPGTRLGSYEIVAPIGAGGMGEVWRAHDPRLGRDVALKVLPESMAKDPEGLARFTREARAVAALNHPHIVTLFSTEEADGVRFMTMELIEGRPLDQVIPPAGLSLPRFFDVAIALADALSAAHQKQITHRDLKPANVMVADDGRVKVLDFGLSRGENVEDARGTGSGEDATLQKLTRAGTILGTMPYMSPEQVEARSLDGRSDLFSLGVVLYEAATGRRPFHGDTSPALLSSILKDHPEPIRQSRPDVPDGVAHLVAHCLEKNPRDRVQSAQELLVELRAERRVWESGASQARSRASAAGPTVVRASDLRIVVLPFAARPVGRDAETIADGLTDEIAAGLARFPYLRVVSRAEVARVGGQEPDATTAAALKARYFVDGTVRTSGQALRASARLTDSETGAHLWAENYDRTLGERGVFDLLDDLSSRIVATVADGSGVLVRSMSLPVRGRPVDELSLDELVLRYFAYAQSFRAEEHGGLRPAFERALERQPSHALGWALLAFLYQQEHTHGFNPLPGSPARCAKAAARAIDVDPAGQAGWVATAAARFIARDRAGLRTAAERATLLNPLSDLVVFVASLLAFSGDWERGLALTRRALDLNPQHAGWYHITLAMDHFRRGEFEEVLEQEKRSNLPALVHTPVAIACAAGHLGRVAEARAAIEVLRRDHPAFLSWKAVHGLYSPWVWDDTFLESFREGFAKALALAGSDA